ncbi:MAG: peroxiredoxin [Rhodobacteraceae bacterium]|nr:peroxiredoxin [Paracoccaceae bacterium]
MTGTSAPDLVGRPLPALSLAATDGGTVDLSALAGVVVVYAYPRTSPPDAPPLPGWDVIPGARGCTPQSCAFRDHHAELRAAGASHVFGLSTQETAYQREAAERLHLPFPLLSDAGLRLADALDLPRFSASGMVLLTRLTMIARDGVIRRLFYPVSDPAGNSGDVLAALRSDLFAE